jgi:hypothetical protein
MCVAKSDAIFVGARPIASSFLLQIISFYIFAIRINSNLIKVQTNKISMEMEERWKALCRLEGDLRRLQQEGYSSFRWSAEEVCRMLLSAEETDSCATLMLQLTLLRRCAEATTLPAQAVGNTAERAGDATHLRVLAAVCARAWSTASMNDLVTCATDARVCV